MDRPDPEPQSRERWPSAYRAALCLCVDVSEPGADDEPSPLVPEPWYERTGADRLLRVLVDIGVSATFTWSRPGPISFDLIGQVRADGHEVAARGRDDRSPAAEWATDLIETRDTLAAQTGAEITGCKAVGQARRAEFRGLWMSLGFAG